MKRSVTIHDLARFSGFSSSTISRALKDNPVIPEATRQQIKQLAWEHNYQPNIIASSLRVGRSKTVGVIVPFINRHFFSNVIGGLEEALNLEGYTLLISQSSESYERELESIRTMIQLRVDALFISIAAGSQDASHLNELIANKIPVFMFDRINRELHVSSVKLDDYEASFRITSHLLEMGYRKLVHYAGPQHLVVYLDRRKGFEDAIGKSGIKGCKFDVFENIITRDTGYRKTLSLIEEGFVPDAICSASDHSALGAILAAKEKGIRIPEQMGISGFANEPFTEIVEPGITTIDQNPQEMGRLIAGLFLSHHSAEPAQMLIHPKLIIRESTQK